MTTVAAELLRDICVSPWDDAPRLILADWLAENGEEEHGEFVRVQCWLAANPSCGGCTGQEWQRGKSCEECDKREAYRKRQAELLRIGGYRWAAPLKHGEGWRWKFERGFVSRVTTTEQLWLEHGAAIVACQPVTGVTLTGKEPGGPSLSGKVGLLWWEEQEPQVPAVRVDGVRDFHLDRLIFDALAGYRDSGQRSLHFPSAQKFYPTRDDALAALSAACVALARRLAKLPALATSPKECECDDPR